MNAANKKSIFNKVCIVSVFLIFLQLIAGEMQLSTDHQLIVLDDGTGFYGLNTVLDFLAQQFIFIWKSNCIEINEIYLSMVAIPIEALDYIRRYGHITAIHVFQLSLYLRIIRIQFTLSFKSNFVISFHKATRTICLAVIAVP